MSPVMVYGATGYMGRLIVLEAVRLGLRPIVAGRSRAKLLPLAEELGLPTRAFSLDDSAAVRTNLSDVALLLNASGPFKRTAQALVDACLLTGTHYLDLAGEVPEFEALAARDQQAQAAGTMLLPGVGFGIVPTDCLAAHLKRRLPTASQLSLAFQAVGGVSQGTAETVIEDLARGGVLRRNGTLVRVAAGRQRRTIDFGQGPVDTLSNPWRGDISTAYYSTGIPTIEVFAVIPSPMRELMRASRYIGPLLGTSFVQGLLKRQVQAQPIGPSDAERAAGKTYIWGEVADEQGRRAVSLLSGPEAYDFSASTAVLIAQRVGAGAARPGFQTPAGLLGADFVLEIPGVQRTDG
jgi:short subunit dehydrogenase-like uncharacterized protein